MPFLRQKIGLLGAFRAGEREAMAEVYWAYVSRVESFLRRFAKPADVADLVQEVFARGFGEKGRRSYDGVRDYGPYLVAIARNLVVDRARLADLELPTDDAAFGEMPMAEREAEPWAEPATLKLVEGYLATLPETLRAVHDVRYVRGLPQRDAAEAIGISRQQLRTREAHLRAGLAEALREGQMLVARDERAGDASAGSSK